MSKKLYIISYHLHGQPKQFPIHTDQPLTESEAWHWAACDVGVARIPKSTRDKFEKMTKQTAGRFGITDVGYQVR
ncbi:DUF6555 family protein (plasmid) [Pseudomonas sp. HR96]|uniref:DUF6555 family protein n=1 Tax=Pseudomonas sp. HR96 TaxID=1027966 RepID=UPI002A764EF9|nr:DUF6555 family protein [Pseudomonas sp. HR96]WPP02420.1 DUF6555 family protein [Pseudomonas sp. HR96]